MEITNYYTGITNSYIAVYMLFTNSIIDGKYVIITKSNRILKTNIYGFIRKLESHIGKKYKVIKYDHLGKICGLKIYNLDDPKDYTFLEFIHLDIIEVLDQFQRLLCRL